MTKNLQELISRLSLQEKADLCSGVGAWHTRALPEHGIPSIMLTDGPHGLRKQKGAQDHMGLNESVPATCFPTAAGLASSWSRELVKQVGVAIGEECQAEGVSIILGPGVNIKRSPLCGRNFEYFSEDPYLSSEMATQYIQGVQSQGVGTSIKHFAVNNQETRRFNIDVILDERTFREIYLASFEDAIVNGKPWTVMAAYNKINGVFCSENRRLLTEILREEWGFEGMVVSDWGAVSEREAALAAGLDLEMPESGGTGSRKIIEAVQNGSLDMETLDTAVERILTVIFRAANSQKEDATYDQEAHHQLARNVAAECMVLLKNENNTLPLENKGTIAVIGAFAKTPRYQGVGSSKVQPTKLDIPLEEIRKVAKDANLLYADGYSLERDEMDKKLIEEAKEVASHADAVILFAGLPDKYDAEGVDRVHLRLPDSHQALIEAVSAVHDKVIVVLLNGSAVEMPWINKVPSLLEAYLGGQAMAGAIADILFGLRNPSGKLAETFPEKLSHTPSYINFPGERHQVEYREGLFVGYRYYDKVDIKPLFPFGHGLSYTTFEYFDLQVDKPELKDTEELKVTVKVKNTGSRTGKEIVQLYVRDVESSVLRPVKELKGFEKVELAPGEVKQVTFTLGKRAFAYYHVELKDWYVESGDFEILIGKSSEDIVLRRTVHVQSTTQIRKKYTLDSTLGELRKEPAGAEFVNKVLMGMGYGSDGRDAPLGMDMEALLHSLKLRVIENGGMLPKAKLEEFLETLNEA
jgi:beta-glucosidase